MSKIKLSAVLASSALTVNLLLPAASLAATPDVSENITQLVDYLKSQQDVDGKILGFGGETSWTIMGMVAAGVDPSTVETSGNSLLDFLAANPPPDTATTGWERDLLAVAAAGENPFTFGGHNYVSKVQSFASGGQIGSDTLVNDDIFGVLSLISTGPSADQTVITGAVDFIINQQNPDGGWSYSTTLDSDNNDSAVAIMALKAAQGAGFTNAGLDNAIDTGVSYLKSNQNPDGGWGYAGSGFSDGASTAWALQALLGDDSVVSSGLNFLVSLQDASGGVQYQAGFGADSFTSAYALSALAQVAFPVSSFEGTFEEPQEPPVDPDPSPEPPADDDEGEVLSENNNDDGDVLAASVLPNTAAGSLFPDIFPTQETAQQSSSLNPYLLALGMVVTTVGFVVSFTVKRLERYGKSERKVYEKA